MSLPGTGKIWMNGKLVDWKDATIHVASHVVHYGSAVFEGARCYETARGPACFRLDAHMRRLIDSARIYRMEPGWDQQTLSRLASINCGFAQQLGRVAPLNSEAVSDQVTAMAIKRSAEVTPLQQAAWLGDAARIACHPERNSRALGRGRY